jgi:hypothetical protein
VNASFGGFFIEVKQGAVARNGQMAELTSEKAEIV